MDLTRALTNPSRFPTHNYGGMAPQLGVVNQDTSKPVLTHLGTRTPYGYGDDRNDYYDAGVQNTNGFDTRHVAQNVSQWQEGDTAAGLPTFCERPQPGTQVFNQRVMAYHMWGVSQFNYMMQHDPAWRRKYGSMLTGAQVMEHFAYQGVQQSQQTLLQSTWSEENNFYVGGRCRMPNLWLAQKNGPIRGRKPGHVNELSHQYLILRRHRYTGALVADPSSWNVPAKKRKHVANEEEPQRRAKRATLAEIDEEPVDPLLEELKKLPPDDPTLNASKGVQFTADALEFQDVNDDKDKQYYWSWDPYVNHVGGPPPPEFYTGDAKGDPHNQYVGAPLHIGCMLHAMKGPQDYTAEQTGLALRALYPKVRNADYLRPLRQLDEMEMMLRARPVPA